MLIVTRQSDDVVVQTALTHAIEHAINPNHNYYCVPDKEFKMPALGDWCKPNSKWKHYPNPEEGRETTPNTDFENNVCKTCAFFVNAPLQGDGGSGDIYHIRDGFCRRLCTPTDKSYTASCGEHRIRTKNG